MKTIIIFLSIAFASCSTPARIHKTGHYIVSTATPAVAGQQVVTFKNYRGQYKIFSDTLSAGDTIKLNVLSFRN